ncbi:hypothetical protein [Allopontixanthobacter sediminis]|uniref:Uncharacterized protein n=1 Tax=Allopontixanthobacter sediminis TaxID=1689985 RepID=A0A845B316_9SPHN|nr:hypothetical protein [Allopontixanthobacter sediminis]MXP44576.1 hypothetical protein [Allopontixanthobacter sediminis]
MNEMQKLQYRIKILETNVDELQQQINEEANKGGRPARQIKRPKAD